jgi:hypothetical protein
MYDITILFTIIFESKYKTTRKERYYERSEMEIKLADEAVLTWGFQGHCR